MLPSAHKVKKVRIFSDDHTLELRGPEAKAFTRMFKDEEEHQREGGAKEVGRVQFYHEEGQSSFFIEEDGKIKNEDKVYQAIMSLPGWIHSALRGEKPSWPPHSS